jgi:endo-1,4-beta-xylanase
VERHFNRISPENDLKWSEFETRPGEFKFDIADEYVSFGTSRNMQVYGHVLVWHSQTPDWVFQDDNGDTIDRDGLLKRVEAHVGALAKRYGGKIGYWDVVNEAFNDNGTLRDSNWRKIIGDDYIEQVFRIADRLLPDSKLVYNDYSMYLPGKRKAAIQLVSDLREAGVRIDAVGMQGHYNMGRPTADELAETLSAYRDAGIEVVFTELDVDVLPSAWGRTSADISETENGGDELNPYKECLPEEVDEAVAARWAELFAVFTAYSDVISGITFWGVSDKHSWLNNWPVDGRTNYPLLFDRKYRAKSNYRSVIEQADKSFDSDTSMDAGPAKDAGDDTGAKD